MYVCYVDEAGCLGVLPSATSDIQPVFVLIGLALPSRAIRPLTIAFLQLKHTFFPTGSRAFSQFLDLVKYEIKGAEIRRNISSKGTPSQQRHALGFLDKSIALLREYDAKVFGRIWIKGINLPFDGRAVYTSSMQYICTTFQHMLTSLGDSGFVVADSRTKTLNANVAHSIFTQMQSSAGNPLDRILEMPTFGHSDNHVGLQFADLLCSALLFPMAIETYCLGHIANVHVRTGYDVLKSRYGDALKDLQYRYKTSEGHSRGGLVVNDAIESRKTIGIFTV